MKKVVYFILCDEDDYEIGKRATLHHVLDHPNLVKMNSRANVLVHTSPVVAIYEDGFETLNTRYKFDHETSTTLL